MIWAIRPSGLNYQSLLTADYPTREDLITIRAGPAGVISKSGLMSYKVSKSTFRLSFVFYPNFELFPSFAFIRILQSNWDRSRRQLFIRVKPLDPRFSPDPFFLSFSPEMQHSLWEAGPSSRHCMDCTAHREGMSTAWHEYDPSRVTSQRVQDLSSILTWLRLWSLYSLQNWQTWSIFLFNRWWCDL